MSKGNQSFQIIHRMISTAKASWAIWFQLRLVEERKGPDYRVTQMFFPFFDAVYHSQIHYVFVLLNDLLKGGKNTHSLAYLIKVCRQEGLSETTARECETLLASVQKHCRGVGILREKYYGHKLIDTTLSEAIEQAGLKIRDVDEMFEAATRIISNLMYPLRIEDHEVDLDSDQYARKTTVEILEMFREKYDWLIRSSRRIETATTGSKPEQE
jgi:hypothetical protein